YAAFFVLSIAVLGALALLVGQQLDAAGVEVPEWAEGRLALVPVLVTATYLFLVWGYLSRRCERQAGGFGLRPGACGPPACAGHDGTTMYPERARGLCPTGIRTFVRALDRVDDLNGGRRAARERPGIGVLLRGLFAWLKAWQHSTMPRRIAFLESLIGDPNRERRFQWRV